MWEGDPQLIANIMSNLLIESSSHKINLLILLEMIPDNQTNSIIMLISTTFQLKHSKAMK